MGRRRTGDGLKNRGLNAAFRCVAGYNSRPAVAAMAPDRMDKRGFGMTRSGRTVEGSSVFEITQSLDAESAFRIKRLLDITLAGLGLVARSRRIAQADAA